MKKLLTLVLVLALCLSAAGVAAIAEEKTWTEPWTIIVPTTDSTRVSSRDTTTGEAIYEKFGIEFKYSPIAGDFEETQALWLASGDIPEVVTLSSATMTSQYIAADALLCLEEYLPSVPNFTKRFAETIPYWRMAGEGKMYFWQQYVQRKLDSDVMYEIVDIAVRTDLLEKAGWPTLVSCTDWINFLKEVTPDAVDVNGDPVDGMIFNGGETWGLEGAVPIMYEKSDKYVAISNASYTFNFETEKYEDFFKNEYVKEGFKFFNDLYKEDLLSPDAWTQSFSDNWDTMKTGSVAAAWYQNDTFLAQCNNALIEAGHPEMSYIVMPIQSDAMVAEGQKRSVRYETTRYVGTIGLSKACTQPERYLALLDYLATDEGAIFFRSGIQGVHWDYVDGVRTPLPELLSCTIGSEKDKDTFCTYATLLYFNELAEDGLPHDLRLTMENYTASNNNERQIEAFNALGWNGNSMGWYTEHMFQQSIGITGAISIKAEDTDIAALSNQMTEYRSKHTYDLITADDFESAYAAAIEEYDKLGGEAVIEYLNNQYAGMADKLDDYAYAE